MTHSKCSHTISSLSFIHYHPSLNSLHSTRFHSGILWCHYLAFLRQSLNLSKLAFNSVLTLGVSKTYILASTPKILGLQMCATKPGVEYFKNLFCVCFCVVHVYVCGHALIKGPYGVQEMIWIVGWHTLSML